MDVSSKDSSMAFIVCHRITETQKTSVFQCLSGIMSFARSFQTKHDCRRAFRMLKNAIPINRDRLQQKLNSAVKLVTSSSFYLKYLDANSIKYDQLGPVVCPPLCCLNAISPSVNVVSMGGNSVVPKSFFPSSL